MLDNKRVVAIILAAGFGKRFDEDIPKQFFLLKGKPLFTYSLQTFAECDAVDGIVLVVPPTNEEGVLETLAGPEYQKIVGKLDRVITGGDTRIASVQNIIFGPDAGTDDGLVLLHDAARPLVSQEDIENCIQALREDEAVSLSIPVSDTLAQVDAGDSSSSKTIDILGEIAWRDNYNLLQTPQGFSLGLLRRAHEALAGQEDLGKFTDDCSIILGHAPKTKIKLIPGSRRNLKLTYPEDILILESLLENENKES